MRFVFARIAGRVRIWQARRGNDGEFPRVLVGRYLELSIKHLRLETRQALNRYEGIRADKLKHGWLVHVSDLYDAHEQVELGVWPKELLPIIELARKHGCGRMLFDCDAKASQSASSRTAGRVRGWRRLRRSKGGISEVRIGSYLDLSPGHLRRQTNLYFDCCDGISVEATADGWLMRTPSLQDAREQVAAGAWAEELLPIVELAWERGSDVILFDRDTWLCKELPYFEEDDDLE